MIFIFYQISSVLIICYRSFFESLSRLKIHNINDSFLFCVKNPKRIKQQNKAAKKISK